MPTYAPISRNQTRSVGSALKRSCLSKLNVQVAQPGKRQKRKRTIVTQSRVSHVLVEEELQNEYERQV